MRQADALRVACRAGRKLHERHVVGAALDRIARRAATVADLRQRPVAEQAARIPDTLFVRKRDQAVLQVRVREQRWSAQLACDPEQLQAMLVADSHGDRHGDDTAEHGAPKRHQEALVRLREYDQFVTWLQALRLQQAQHLGCPSVQLGVRNDCLLVFAVNEAYAAVTVAPRLE